MRKIINVILGVGLIAGLIYFGIWVIIHVSVTWIPFIAAGVGFLVSRIYEAYKENRARLYEKKREVYSNLLKPYQNVLINSIVDSSTKIKRSTDVTPEILEFAANAAFDAIIYGSDEVVRAYGHFRNVSVMGQATPERILGHLSKLLRAIRKDLGHSWTNLSDGEILSMFINLTPEDQIKYNNISKGL